MIESRKLVPDYFESSRDYQVFLKLLDLMINACKADTDYYTSLLSPLFCKARILPLLSNHVGYNYDYREKVKMNRIITKEWANLKRNRGSIVGITMAVALSMSQLEDLDSADILKLFSVSEEQYIDRYGRKRNKILIYLYHQTYLSKMYDLIEAVRPAGTIVEIIPAVPINSSETIVLTDEYRMLGYDYVTGKLIKIGDINIVIENSWEILYDGQSTGEFIVDDKIYDQYHNDTGKYLDSHQRIFNVNEFTGEIVRAPYIYKVSDYEEGTPFYLVYIDEDSIRHTLKPTGKYFNLEHGARILNTCYQIKNGGVPTGFFVTNIFSNSDKSWVITDETKENIIFYLKDYNLDGNIVKKVFRKSDDTKYNWHIDPETLFFVKDNDGREVDRETDLVPWDSFTYISKKRFIMNTSASGVMYTTQYFVNDHEDVQDTAGNIILSVKDRYKVSDSASVGFSEVHNMERETEYNRTFRYSRSLADGSDRDFYKSKRLQDYNDYATDSGYTDERIKITLDNIHIDRICREWDGTNNIGTVTLSSEVDPNNPNRVKIDIEHKDIAYSVGNSYIYLDENENNSMFIKDDSDVAVRENLSTGDSRFYSESPQDCYFYIDTKLRNGDTPLSIFKELQFTFLDSLVSEDKCIQIRWKLAEFAEMHYNVYELPEIIMIDHQGEIKKKKLYFDDEPIIVTGKVYDGNTRCVNTELEQFVEKEES